MDGAGEVTQASVHTDVRQIQGKTTWNREALKKRRRTESQQKGAACTAPLKQPAAQEESETNRRQGWVFVERFRSRAEGTKEKYPDKSMSRCIRPERHRLVKGRMRASGLDTEQGRKRRGWESQVGSVLERL